MQLSKPHPADKQQLKIELAQSASGIGAFVLGIGVGVLFLATVSVAKFAFLAAGIVLHGWGMMALSRMKNTDGSPMFYTNHWLRLLMWVCAVALIALIVFLINALA
jgi:hypothetical protein